MIPTLDPDTCRARLLADGWTYEWWPDMNAEREGDLFCSLIDPQGEGRETRGCVRTENTSIQTVEAELALQAVVADHLGALAEEWGPAGLLSLLSRGLRVVAHRQMSQRDYDAWSAADHAVWRAINDKDMQNAPKGWRE